MSNKCLDDELYYIYIQDGKQVIESLREIYEKGRADIKAEIKEKSVITNGGKLYGANTKVIIITEEKYKEIFG